MGSPMGLVQGPDYYWTRLSAVILQARGLVFRGSSDERARHSNMIFNRLTWQWSDIRYPGVGVSLEIFRRHFCHLTT